MYDTTQKDIRCKICVYISATNSHPNLIKGRWSLGWRKGVLYT